MQFEMKEYVNILNLLSIEASIVLIILHQNGNILIYFVLHRIRCEKLLCASSN